MASSKSVAPNQPVTINTKKPYRPMQGSQDGTAETWALVQTAVAKGPVTRQQLFTLLQKERNHASFVSYALQRQWLVPTGKVAKA